MSWRQFSKLCISWQKSLGSFMSLIYKWPIHPTRNQFLQRRKLLCKLYKCPWAAENVPNICEWTGCLCATTLHPTVINIPIRWMDRWPDELCLSKLEIEDWKLDTKKQMMRSKSHHSDVFEHQQALQNYPSLKVFVSAEDVHACIFVCAC